jgi:hypothetical protein
MHHVPVLYHVILPFDPELSGLFDGRLAAQLEEVFTMVDLRFDKTLLKVCVDHRRGLRRFVPFVEGPGPDFFFRRR